MQEISDEITKNNFKMKEYFINEGFRRLGPYDKKELLKQNINKDTLIWTFESGEKKASEFPEILEALEEYLKYKNIKLEEPIEEPQIIIPKNEETTPPEKITQESENEIAKDKAIDTFVIDNQEEPEKTEKEDISNNKEEKTNKKNKETNKKLFLNQLKNLENLEDGTVVTDEKYSFKIVIDGKTTEVKLDNKDDIKNKMLEIFENNSNENKDELSEDLTDNDIYKKAEKEGKVIYSKSISKNTESDETDDLVSLFFNDKNKKKDKYEKKEKTKKFDRKIENTIKIKTTQNKKIKLGMLLSFVSFLFFFPIGIIAIIFSLKAKSLELKQEYEKAMLASKVAMLMGVLGIITGMTIVIILIRLL